VRQGFRRLQAEAGAAASAASAASAGAERVPQRCALCQRTASLRSAGLGFAEPGPALRAGVLRFASD
ncbi:hypothetical protein ABZW02_33375, partial [Streptomyces sp. NPDC005180]|uniref:hypothetical protein n=1 Tax=Streptomyces sp. NPDC005180 TaxID=3156868 RepID=UPI0033B9DA3F